MKKLYAIVAAALLSASAMAQDIAGDQYTEDLTIIVTEEDEFGNPQKVETKVGATTVTVGKNADGSYNFQLKNFVLVNGDNIMPVGNITLLNVPATEENGVAHLTLKQDINITAGDDDVLETTGMPFWAGPVMLGDVPLDFVADVTATRIYAHIDIDLAALNQVIEVTLGEPLSTGISKVQGAVKAGATYDLQGRRVQQVARGLQILNGKKILK